MKTRFKMLLKLAIITILSIVAFYPSNAQYTPQHLQDRLDSINNAVLEQEKHILQLENDMLRTQMRVSELEKTLSPNKHTQYPSVSEMYPNLSGNIKLLAGDRKMGVAGAVLLPIGASLLAGGLAKYWMDGGPGSYPHTVRHSIIILTIGSGVSASGLICLIGQAKRTEKIRREAALKEQIQY